jgi:hypothetical protein
VGAAGERAQHRAEAMLGKGRRVDSARELPRFGRRVGQSRRDAGQISARVVPAGRDIGLRGPRGQRE